jgi:type I restriction enzyme, S subunit
MATTTLGELISLQRGYDLTETQRRSGKVPIVGSAGIHGYHDVAKAKGPGVTLGRSGASFGKVSYVREDYWPHNTTIFVTDFKGNEPLFVRYLLESLDFSSLNSGSAQQSLNRNFVYPVKVPKFSLSEQRRIAGILSAYDELIENSQRRIRILESMTRALYREWFVHFRFPGHERGRIVDGIPEGWKRRPLEDVAEFRLGKMLDQEKNRGDLLPYLANINVRWGEFDLGDLRRMRFEQDELEMFGLKFGDIVMCEGGEPGRCAIWKDQVPGMMIQKAIHRIRCRENMDHVYLYHSLRDEGESGRLAALFTGATIKHLPREKLAKVMIVVPPAPLLEKFGAATSSMEEQIHALQRQTQNLRRTRDLLLPHLLSGQVSLAEA